MLITLEKLVKVNPNLQVVLKRENIEKLKIELLLRFKTLTEVSKKSGRSRKFVSDVLIGKWNPDILLSLRLVKLSGLQINDVIEKITLKRRPNDSFIGINDFPIKTSPELASLVGRVCGDGNLGTCFQFTNKTQETIEDVIDKVESLPIQNLIMNRSIRKGVENIRFSSLLKDILIASGAPKGNKIKNEFLVPKWIKNGSKEIRIAFLRALFDDESSISKRTVQMNLSKNIKLKKNLIEFLLEIKSLLNSLKINGVTIPKSKRIFRGKNSTTIRKSISINGFSSINQFNDLISFVSTRKAEKLKKTIENTQVIEMSKEERKEMLMNLFRNEEFLRRIDIARGMKINKNSISDFMKKFEKDNLVTKIKLVPGNRNFRVLFALNPEKLKSPQIDVE